MVDIILFYVFYGVGAGIVWLAKGCRTSYSDELADRNETRNALVAIVSFFIFFGLAFFINN